MEIKTLTLRSLAERLQGIPSAPKQLYVTGDLAQLLKHRCVSVVDSRKLSSYGRQVTAELSGEIRSLGANQWSLS